MNAEQPGLTPTMPATNHQPLATPVLDLIPVRALNQVSYCARLYYLEYVEAVMPINEFVEEGLFHHRRVNDPGLANRTRKEGAALRTRSVSLSSERLGITAKLDLLEEEGDAIRPVETKRSAAPKDDDGEPSFWENDAIQLCAQALLVEENQQVSVPEGVIYYVGSNTRVTVPFDESLRSRTLAAIALVRELAGRDTPPEPLPPELRHRCYGCSLAPVCLPEETLYLIHQPPVEAEPPATEPASPPAAAVPLPRVIPRNDEKAVLYAQEQGAYIGRRGDHLVVTLKGQEIERVPIVAIRQVVIFGNIQVSTQALQTLVEADVPVAFLNMYGKFIATVMPAPPKNMALRAAQYTVFADPARALALARAAVAAKIANQRTLLMRSLRSLARDPGDGSDAALGTALSTPQEVPEGDLSVGSVARSGDLATTVEGAPGVGEAPAECHDGAECATRSEPGEVELRAVQTADVPVARAGDEPAVREMADMPGRVATAPDPLASSSFAPRKDRVSDEPAVRDMADMLRRVATAPDPGVLLGLEGQAAALYFANFGRMLKARAPGATFDFTTRNRRPPRDPVNSLLSFAYALLTKDCFSAACTVGFDPYRGFYHGGRHGRPSLALDLVEEFRPVIADSVVLTLINNQMLTAADFLTWRDACYLTDAGRKTFFEVYEQRKATEVTHPVFGYKMSYGRMLEVQARMLAAHVRGEIPRYVGFTTR